MDWSHSGALPTLINLPNPSRACPQAYLPGDCVSPQASSLTLTLPNTGQGVGMRKSLRISQYTQRDRCVWTFLEEWFPLLF